MISSLWVASADPASHDRWQERRPRHFLCVLNVTDRVAGDELHGIILVICVDLVRGISANEMEESEGATWMSVKPFVWDSEEVVTVDNESLTVKDALGNLLSVPKFHGRM